MWCSHCQQEVPGVVSPQDDSVVCCARCHNDLSAKTGSHQSSSTGTTGSDLPDFVEIHDWNLELDSDLRAVDRVVRSLRTKGATPPSEESQVPVGMRIDERNEAAPRWHVADRKRQRGRSRRWATIAWCSLSLGMMCFVCGTVLMGWSFFAARGELWTIGMPVTLIGQALLLLGVVLQLESLWHTNDQTTKTLDDLDEQINELQHSTSMLSTTHSSGAQSFYAHMAEGANPQLLLADLKGQIDMLAVRLAKERSK